MADSTTNRPAPTRMGAAAGAAADAPGFTPSSILALGFAAAALLAALAAPVPEGWNPASIRVAGLTVATVTLLASGALPLGITAVGFLTFGMLLKVQPAAVVFSGFASGALWLVFGGMVIGVAVNHTGLGERFARAALQGIGNSYGRVLTGIAAVAMALSFVMPSSMGRVVLLVPLVVAIAEALGFGPRSRGRAGMVMVAALVCFTPGGTILPSHLPGMILAGAAETLYGTVFTYGGYLLVNFPVMGVLRAGLIVAVALILFRDSPRKEAGPSSARTALKRGEIRLAAILALALVFWVTDTLHGIAAPWVGLAAAFVLLLPGLNLVPAKTVNERLDYASVLYTAAVIGMGASIAASGLASELGHWLLDLVPSESAPRWASFMALSASSALMGMITTNPAVPAVLSPLAGDLAELTRLPVETVLYTQVFGFTNVVLPYQASPILVAMGLSGVGIGEGSRFTLAVTALSLAILLPLEFLWWQWLGLI